MRIFIYTVMLVFHLTGALASTESSMEDADYMEDTAEMLDTLPEAFPDTEEEEDLSTDPKSVLEVLPEPEAYHRRRPKPHRPHFVSRIQRPQILQVDFQDRDKESLFINNFYKSALDNIQQEKLPTGNSDSRSHSSESPLSLERLTPSYEITEDPLRTDESWKWFTTLVSTNSRRYRNPIGRQRGRPHLKSQVRARNRPREVLNKRRPSVGNQNLRRPPAVPFRPRTHYQPIHPTRPRFREPTGPRHRPTPAFVVTDPTTTPPDTLSVHNIAGPPYYDTIPPNILFVDEEITSPVSFPTASFTSSTTPISTSEEAWRPVTHSVPRWTNKATTSIPTIGFTQGNRYQNGAERRNTDTPISGDEEDSKWKSHNMPNNNLDWNVDTDREWFNIWNHNWGDEWGRKWEAETTTQSQLTSSPNSGYSKPVGTIRWEDEHAKYVTEGTKNNDVLPIQSLADAYPKGTLTNHRLHEKPVAVKNFPEDSSDSHRYLPTSERPLKFPDSSQAASNVHASLEPNMKFHRPGPNQRFAYDDTQYDYSDTYSSNSRSSGNIRGNFQFKEYNEGNRRMSSTPALFDKSEIIRNPPRRHRPNLQQVEGPQKSGFLSKTPVAIGQIARNPGPKQSTVIVSRVPPHIWKPGRRGTIRRQGRLS